MATSTPQEKDEKDVTCLLCLDIFTDPRLLPCLHTYCKKCLEDLVSQCQKKGEIYCPQCRHEVKITCAQVSNLKINTVANDIIAALALTSEENADSPPGCETCDANAHAWGRCEECYQLMCEACIASHRRIRVTKHQHIESMEEIRNKGTLRSSVPQFCHIHEGERIKLFCDTCDELICQECTIDNHREHKYGLPKTVIDREKKTIIEEIARVKAVAKQIELLHSAIVSEQQKLEEATTSVTKEVNSFIDTKIKVLEDVRSNLMDRIQEVYQWKVKQLAAQEDTVSVAMGNACSVVAFTERLCKQGSDIDFLSVKNNLKAHHSEIANKVMRNKVRESGELKFVVDESHWESMAGSISINPCFLVDPQKCVLKLGGSYSTNGVFKTHINLFSSPVTYKFKLITMDKEGKTCNAPANVRATLKDNYNKECDLTVGCVSNANGESYEFRYSMSNGSWQYILSVMVDGEHIKESPFQWDVKCS